MENEPEILNSTVELWDRICTVADFKSKEYDRRLLHDIRKELGIRDRCHFRSFLVKQKTTPEQLLAVLLKVMEPFSIMMNDLLAMFKTAGAKYSDKNIQIEFDFKKAREQFGLDLENFRLCTQKLNNVVYHEFRLESSSPINDFKNPLEDILMDKHLFPNKCNNPSFPVEINKWLKEYDDGARNDKNWPDYFPNPPESEVERIDKIIAEIWQLPKAACKLYNGCYLSNLKRKKSLTKKQELLKRKKSLAKKQELLKRKKSPIGNEIFPPDCRFYSHEAESWIGDFVRILVCLVENIKIKKNDDLNIDVIVDRLEEFKKSLPIESFVRERLVETLLDILNLPLWKKRYALYSAWVATQIISALDEDDWEIVYNVKGEVLSFNFRGSVIAHLKHHNFDIELHAELKTECCNIKYIGGERTEGIKPDYSLRFNNTTDRKDIILAVECKQYKDPENKNNSSTKKNYKYVIDAKENFTNAIVDYARVLYKAQVILVNYTKIPESFRTELTENFSDISDRVPYYDILSPGNVVSYDSFKTAVRNALSEERCFKFFSTECYIELDLNRLSPKLGLILEIDDLKVKKEINYEEKGNLDQYPFADFDGDIPNENNRGIILHDTIKVTRILSGYTYKGYVYNHSDEEPNGEISVSVKIGKFEKTDSNPLNIDKWTNSKEFCVFRIENDVIYIFDKYYNITN